MIARLRSLTTSWTSLVPVLAVVLLVFTWGRDLPAVAVVLVTLVFAGAVLARSAPRRGGRPPGRRTLRLARPRRRRHDHRGGPDRHPV